MAALVNSATITGIVNADVAPGAAIAFSKIAQANIDGSLLTGLVNIVSGAGVVPVANLTSVAQKGANSDITSLTGLTTPLSVAQGGTGSSGDANAASGVVVLNASSQLPAVSGALLTNLPVKIKVGSYTGNGAATQAITGVGFQPTFMIILKTSGSDYPVFRSVSYPANYSSNSGCAYATDMLRSFDADGFTVGNATQVNTNGVTYGYLAIGY